LPGDTYSVGLRLRQSALRLGRSRIKAGRRRAAAWWQAASVPLVAVRVVGRAVVYVVSDADVHVGSRS